MILIYTNKITNRIKYTFNLIFRELLNVDIELTSNKEDFIAFEGIKFSYAKQPLDNELFFAAGNLLFERGITNIELSFIEFEGTPAFVPVYLKESVMPFEPFAASFYLISRYE